MAATLHDVAARAEVSIKTVSRVVNGEAAVAPATADRVRRAIGELGYVPNITARRLVSRRAFTLGIVYQNRSWNWLSDFQRGAIDRGLAAGYEILMHPCDIESREEQERILRMVDECRVDGLILTPPCGDSTLVTEGLDARAFPFVRIAPTVRDQGSPTVSMADREGARAAARLLVELGHHALGFVMGDPAQRSSHDRLAGFEAGLPRGLRPAVVQGDFSFEAGLDAGYDLLRRPDRPTAIFASNDDMAVGILAAAHELGLVVPDDLSIIGCDDVPLAGQVRPRLTTVRQPTVRIAATATDMLIRWLDDDPVTEHTVLDMELVVRESTGPPCF